MKYVFYAFMLAFLHLHAELYYPSKTFSEQANVNNRQLFDSYEKIGLENFWAKEAEQLPWFKKWDTILSWNPPHAKWFEGGLINASYVCLDHNIHQNKGDKIALLWEGEDYETRTLTYQQLLDEVCRCANLLKSLGVNKGDRVTIYMPIMPETIVSMLACARIGAPHLLIFGGVGAGGIRDRLIDSQSKLVITVDGGFRRGKVLPYKDLVDEAVNGLDFVQKTLVFNRANNPISWDKNRDVSFSEKIKGCSSFCKPEPMNSEDMLFLLYTSGSTGKPKGILHTTGGYLVGVHSTYKWVFDIKDKDIYWCTADMGWITGNSYSVYGPLSNGATQVIYEGAPDFPNRGRVWDIIQKYKVSIFYTAPTLIRTFMKWGDEWINKHDVSSLRLLGSIGEPINPDVWEWYFKVVGSSKTPIVDTWFQTETGAFVIAPLPGYTPLIPGSVTQALPGYQVGVLNEDGENVKKGFLAITKPFPSMLRGIYGDEARFKKTYWNHWDGKYYFTGDGATLDDDGYFWVYGRIDDVIKTSGHRVGSAELENTTLEYFQVAEAAAVGIPHPLKGDEIYLFVVLKNKYLQSMEAVNNINDLIVKNIGSYARPGKIVFVDELPKNRSGKILRRLLRNIVMKEPLGDLTTLENPSSIEAIRKVYSE
ncbi:MAG: acetate--CoA ligase [Rhabdochlamydiaceae bacterium]|nr:acetate--CoA ligase [Rhabdochlamydiaceae bacterium]